jgi:hypothetical protein
LGCSGFSVIKSLHIERQWCTINERYLPHKVELYDCEFLGIS